METGCVFDNHRGIYMGEAIIELAESYGFVPENDEDKNPESEFHWDLVTVAEHYLNVNVAEEGYCYGFGECGDFMYMPISWFSEE